MTQYLIGIQEVHYSWRRIEADSLEEALHDAGGATEEYLEYSHTMDTDTWITEVVPTQGESA